MMMMTNQERKCVICLTLVSSQPQQTAANKENVIVQKFCEEILRPETLDELQTIPGNEFETACKKCEQKLSSILRTNHNLMEEEKLINNLCEETVNAIHEHLDADGNSMLRKLKCLQDPAKSFRVTDSTATGSNIVIRKGMEKATRKFEERQDALRAIVAAINKLSSGFVVTSNTSEENPMKISTFSSMANVPGVPEDRNIEMDIGPVLPVALPKTEPPLNNDDSEVGDGDEANPTGGNPSTVDVEAEFVKTEELHSLRNRPVNRYDKATVDPSSLLHVTSNSDVTSTTENAPQIQEMIDLCSDDDVDDGAEENYTENAEKQKLPLPEETSQELRPTSAATASVADVSSSPGKGAGSITTTTTVVIAETDPGSSGLSSSAENLESECEDNREAPFILPATGNRKRKLPETVLPPVTVSPHVSNHNLESGSGVGNPKRDKSDEEEKQEKLTKSPPLEIDQTTLKSLAIKLKTAVKNIDVGKIKSLLQRGEVQEILKRCTSPENQEKWKEYKGVSTLIHECIHSTHKFGDGDPKYFSAIEIIQALVNVNKALLEAIELPNQDTPILAWGVTPQLIEKLIEFGANPFAVDTRQKTFLHDMPLSLKLCRYLITEHPKILYRLVKMKDSIGRTPLLSSLERDYDYTENNDLPQILELFKIAGADFNAVDSHQDSALSLAILKSYSTEVIELLVKFGRRLSWKGAENNMALLHLAVQHGKKEAVRFLLEKNLDVNVEDAEGLTPLDYLAFKLRPRLFQKSLNGLRNKNCCFEIGLMLKKCGGKFNTKTNNEQSLLHFVAAINDRCWDDKLELYRGWDVELLLRLGFPVNGMDSEGNTPLHSACESIIRVNSESEQLATKRKDPASYILLPLQRRRWMDQKETVKTLVRYGADLKAINKVGKTPQEMIPKEIQHWQFSEIEKLLSEMQNSGKDEEQKIID